MATATVQAMMAAVATKLTAGISGLRVYQPPRDDIAAPAAVVAWPAISYDATMAGGLTRWEVPVIVLVGKVSDRQSGANLQGYMKASGSGSVKAVLEADPTLGGVVGSTRVERCDVEARTVAGVEYLSAVFTVDVIG